MSVVRFRPGPPSPRPPRFDTLRLTTLEPVTHAEIVNAKPREKPYRLFDGRGLYLEVAPSGGRWWRFKYRFKGKEKRLSLGVYPEVSIKAARDRLDEARRKLASGVDPADERRSNGATSTDGAPSNSFEAIAREWFTKHSPAWAPRHGDKIIRSLETNIFPGSNRIRSRNIKPLELLTVIQRIEQRGRNETAHRALQNCDRVFRYAVATGRADRDITRDLIGALAPIVERHHASIVEPKAVGALLRAIDSYDGSFVAALSHISEAGFVYYIPAYMRLALNQLGAVGDPEWEAFGSTIFHLTNRSNYTLGRFKRFSDTQIDTVVEFL